MKSINSPRQGSFFWRNSSSVSHPPPTRTMTVLRRIRTKRSFWESPNCKRCTKRSIRYYDILSDILCSGSLLNGYTFHGQNIGSETNSARYKSVSAHRDVLSTKYSYSYTTKPTKKQKGNCHFATSLDERSSCQDEIVYKTWYSQPKELKKWLTYSVFVFGYFGVLTLPLATQSLHFRLNLLLFSLWFLRLLARLKRRQHSK